MILKRLKEYWEGQGDGLSAGYQRAFLTRELVFGGGRFIGTQSLSGQPRGKGKDSRDGMMYPVPREQPQRTSGVRPRLLQDNPEYALGFVGEGRDPKKVTDRHAAYVQLLEDALRATNHPGIGTVLNWLQSGGAEDLIRSGRIEGADDLLFRVDGEVPTDDSSLREYWAAKDSGVPGFCLVTGEMTSVGAAMPYPAKGVPGGQTSGTMLVSVNMRSGESYGLEGNLTSPIGTASAEAICNGLNKLLASSDNSLRINDTVYLYWHRERNERDALRALKEPTAEDASAAKHRFQRRRGESLTPSAAVAAHLVAPQEGGSARKVESYDFYVLALTANASRIVVRDYFETTLENVQSRIDEWFARLELIGTEGKPIRPPAAWQLASSLYRESKDVPKPLAVQLVDCALRGRRLPPDLLSVAVRRNAVMQGPYALINRKRVLSTPRLALIKACLVPDPDSTLAMLNENLEIPAYQCGRLLSILESIQRLAIPNLNATLTDRHYGAACATPGVIFGGLVKDATSAHLPKLRKNRMGAFVALDRRLQQVLSRIDQLPRTLDYEGQGYFALGYYHQRAHDVAEAIAKKNAGKADEAPTLLDEDMPPSEETEQ